MSIQRATRDQIERTPFKDVWKGGFQKLDRRLIKRALRAELVRTTEDTQEWRDIRCLLECMGEKHHSVSEIACERREKERLAEVVR